MEIKNGTIYITMVTVSMNMDTDLKKSELSELYDRANSN